MVFTCNRIPFVCNSWIYELLHNKMEPPLVPVGGHWLRDLKYATETETYTGLDSIPDPPQSVTRLSFTACELGGGGWTGAGNFLPVDLGVPELEGPSGVN